MLRNHFTETTQLQALQQDLASKEARWAEQEQKLSIGIIGQVKAGKSSFLNALLFNGKAILPEAATPKTANLTKVSFAEQYALQVEYYTLKEWDDIQTFASISSDSSEAKVAKELVAMVQTLPKDEVLRCLEVGSEHITADSLDGLQGILNQYTGNDGSHTPLVKSTEITLPTDELKGFEVVDTPGMNDPVASRTQKTREYMANCDVVFFLSRCSQFLDKADDELLRDQLPNKGVKRLVVVAGQFDSTIIDDGYDRSSLNETIDNIKMRLLRQADKKAQQLAQSKHALTEQQQQMVAESLSNPIFASTFAYGYRHWSQSQWSKSMLHSFAELTELAEDEWDYEFTPQDWEKVANFEPIKLAFEQAKADRQSLLAEQQRSYLPDAYNAMLAQYESLENSIQKRIELIQTREVADIEKAQLACERRASSIASTLAYTLSQATNDAKQSAAELIAQLKHDQSYFSQLSTRQGSREESYSYSVSTSVWYNPFSWGSSRTVYSTRTVSYDYLNPNDAIEQVNQYGADSARQIVSLFGQIISPNALKLKLKQALLKDLDTQSEEFDPSLFKSMLENFVTKLDLPIFDIELGDTTSLISNNFSGEVTSQSEMEALRSKLSQSLAMVLDKLKVEFESQFSLLINQLELAGQGLSVDLTADLQQELAKVKLQIQDKENEVLNYRDYLSQVMNEKLEIEEKLATLKN
jgi:predicted GTPase